MRLRLDPNIKRHKKTDRRNKMKPSKKRKKCVFTSSKLSLLKTTTRARSKLPSTVSKQLSENQSQKPSTKIAKFKSKSRKEEKQYNCDHCHYSTRQLCTLKVHNRIHTGEKPFKCHFCDSAFSHFGSRKYHERAHTGEKPFLCDYCSYAAVKLYNYKNHLKMHTKINAFKCDECNFAFSEARILKIHRVIHVDDNHYKCNDCSYTSVKLSNFKIHQQCHSGKERKLFYNDTLAVKEVKSRWRKQSIYPRQKQVKKPKESRIFKAKRNGVENTTNECNLSQWKACILEKIRHRDTTSLIQVKKEPSSTLIKRSPKRTSQPSALFAQSLLQLKLPKIKSDAVRLTNTRQYYKCAQCQVVSTGLCRMRGHEKTLVSNPEMQSNESLLLQNIPLRQSSNINRNLETQNDFNSQRYQMPDCIVKLAQCDRFITEKYQVKKELNSEIVSQKLPFEPSPNSSPALRDKSKRNSLLNYSYNCVQCKEVYTEVCKIKAHNRVRQIKEAKANLHSQNPHLELSSCVNQSLIQEKPPKNLLNLIFQCAQCNADFTEVCRITGHKRVRRKPAKKDLPASPTRQKTPLGPSSHVKQQINSAKPVKICFVNVERLSKQQIEKCSSDPIKMKVTRSSPKKDYSKTTSSISQLSQSLIMNEIIDLWSDSTTNMFEYDIYDLMTIKSDPKGFFNNTGL